MKFKYIFIMFFILLFMPHANACTVNGSTQYNLTNAAIRFSMVYHFDGISNFGGGDTLYCYNDTDGWHNLTVIPTDYILINISKWNMRDDHRKTFNESCNITTATTNHVITGYPSNGAINVYINSTFYENVNIEDGIFTWLYSDGYLDEIYEIDLLYSNITASFNVTKNEGIDPLSVQFIDASTNATSWYWDFGDGETSTAKNPYHTYNVDGVYTVTLNASNSGGYDIEYKTNYITVTSRFAESSGIASTSAEMMLICSVLIISTMAVAGLRGKIEINELITFSIGMIFIMVVIYLMYGIATVIQNTFS